MDLLFNFGISVLGVVIYFVFKARDVIGSSDFSWSRWQSENLAAALWSVIVVLLFSFAQNFVPDAINSLFSILQISIDWDGGKGHFLVLGVAIAGISRNVEG